MAAVLIGENGGSSRRHSDGGSGSDSCSGVVALAVAVGKVA